MDTLIDGSLNGVSSRAAAASDTAAAPSGGCPRGLTYLSISLSPGVDIAAAGTRDPAWARIWQSPTVRRRVDLPAWDARGGRGCGWGTRYSLGPSVPVRDASPRRRCAGTRVTSPFAHPPAMLAPATTWRGARGETRTSSGTKRLVAASQIRAVLSLDPVATRLPSGDQATHQTGPLCPSSRSTVAPASTRARTTPPWRILVATRRGVVPSFRAAFTSTPLAMRARTTDSWPFFAAMRRGVHPSYRAALGSARPVVKHASTPSSQPSSATKQRR